MRTKQDREVATALSRKWGSDDLVCPEHGNTVSGDGESYFCAEPGCSRRQPYNLAGASYGGPDLW